jgi:hypothetical protein
MADASYICFSKASNGKPFKAKALDDAVAVCHLVESQGN